MLHRGSESLVACGRCPANEYLFLFAEDEVYYDRGCLRGYKRVCARGDKRMSGGTYRLAVDIHEVKRISGYNLSLMGGTACAVSRGIVVDPLRLGPELGLFAGE